MKILELFGGIGAPRKALELLDYEVESTYIEYDPAKVAAYNAIYDENFEASDIRDHEPNGYDHYDMIVHGSPCTNFSVAGNGEGAAIGSETESSLLWESVRIITMTRPKVVVWENVGGALSNNGGQTFRQYITTMSVLGYNNSWRVLRSSEFGIPNNRPRLFVVSHLEHEFDFNELQHKPIRKLDEFVDFSEHLFDWSYTRDFKDTTNYYQLASNTGEMNVQAWRIYKRDSIFGTFGKRQRFKIGVKDTANNFLARYITTVEAYKLLGFTEQDHDRAAKVSTRSQLYAQAGDSICVPVLVELFSKLFKENNEH